MNSAHMFSRMSLSGSKSRHSSLFLLLLFLLFFIGSSSVASLSDSEFLLRFKYSLENSTSLDGTWDSSQEPCSGRTAKWAGILCSEEGLVYGVKLENMSLRGEMDVAALASLPRLRSLSLMHNDFAGPLPDVAQLGSLKSLYLSGNSFSGGVDSALFLRMMSLKKLHLAHNRLDGPIPVSLVVLPKLIDLRLEGNLFDGPLPNFAPRRWLSFNVSNNFLRGPIPPTLKTIDATSFYGNEELCGAPLGKCTASKSLTLSVVVVVIVVVMALSAIGAVVVIVFRVAKPGSGVEAEEEELHQPQQGGRKSVSGDARLWFVREGEEQFGMQELLGAPAEMLGSGSFGSTYKATMGRGGPVVVVKRFKHMNNVGRDDFHEHMKRLGALSHPNILPLIAFYFKRDEKLFISHFAGNHTLSFLLHGGGGGERAERLEGAARVNIVKGVARGLRYLQEELPGVMAAHGNLRTSNVVVRDGTGEAVLSEYSLGPLINQEHAEEEMAAYMCPEYVHHGRITKKSDVWSLGLLILETLTAKRDNDLLAWAASSDPDTVLPNGDPALRRLLKIGLDCCEPDVDARLDLKQALHQIENCHHSASTSTKKTEIDIII